MGKVVSKIAGLISYYRREHEKRKIRKIYEEVFQTDPCFEPSIYDGETSRFVTDTLELCPREEASI